MTAADATPRPGSPRWDRHDPLTDPGPHAARLAGLARDPASLAAAVRGWLVHGDYLHLYGLGDARAGDGARTTLPLADRLDAVLALDPGNEEVLGVLRGSRPASGSLDREGARWSFVGRELDGRR